MKNLIIFVLTAIVLHGCDLTSFFQGKVDADLNIGAEKIEHVQDLEATLVIRNMSRNTVKYKFPSTCQIGYMIGNEGEVLFDSRENMVCARVLTKIELKSGECRRFDLNFHSLETIEPGTYTLRAFLLEDYSEEAVKEFVVE